MNIKYVGEHHPRQKWQSTHTDLRNFVVCCGDKEDCLKSSAYIHTLHGEGAKGLPCVCVELQAEARNLQINCVSHVPKLRNQPGGILSLD